MQLPLRTFRQYGALGAVVVDVALVGLVVVVIGPTVVVL